MVHLTAAEPQAVVLDGLAAGLPLGHSSAAPIESVKEMLIADKGAGLQGVHPPRPGQAPAQRRARSVLRPVARGAGYGRNDLAPRSQLREHSTVRSSWPSTQSGLQHSENHRAVASSLQSRRLRLPSAQATVLRKSWLIAMRQSRPHIVCYNNEDRHGDCKEGECK